MSRTVFCVLMLLALLGTGDALADVLQGDLIEGRSAVETCERNVEVCGVMRPDRLVPFADRCAAQDDGAQHIIVGPCFDEN